MVEYEDCPYMVDDSNGIHKKGKCTITNDICAFIRYCTKKQRIVSSELFFRMGCGVKNKYLGGNK
jgi:hypothetical protein